MKKKEFENIESIVLKGRKKLSKEQKKIIANEIKKIKEKIEKLEKDLLKYGRLLDYNELKEKGFSIEKINEFSIRDVGVVDFADQIMNSHKDDHDYMFGYPANMIENSAVTKYLRWLESQMFFTNSCGNAYGQGNYRMNNAIQELMIIDRIKENLGLNSEDYWGYITMGGTEGNMWGIREGFSKYKDGILYYSDSAHYSVAKVADMKSPDKYVTIPSKQEKIDTEELLTTIVKNYKEKGAPAILLLTFGTTTFGSIDDIDLINKVLDEYQIPHYIHVDAALYGGIPKNQINSPINKMKAIADSEIDSISVSLHKYLGNQRTNGVLLSKSKSYQKFIDYIGNQDITFLGSRDFPTFSILQQIDELYNRSNPEEYIKNIKTFERLLNENEIPYIKGEENGNIFVIENPGDEICKKYQLATFTKDGNDYAHIIVFPYHQEDKIKELVNDIKTVKNKDYGDDHPKLRRKVK